MVLLVVLLGITSEAKSQWYNLFKKEVNIKDLAINETGDTPIFYYEGELYSGVVIHSWNKFEVKDGRLTGLVKMYHDDGTLYAEATFNNGIKEGSFKTYHDNGTIKEQGTYKNGEFNGAYDSYFSDKRIEQKCTYMNGLKEGKCTEYYNNGNIRIQRFYKHDQEQGLCEFYYQNGSIAGRFNYLDGELNGPYQEFSEDGKTTHIGNFNNGIRVGNWTHDDYYINELYTVDRTKLAHCEESFKNNGELIFRKTTYINSHGETETSFSLNLFNKHLYGDVSICYFYQ